jgi:hypothetical protein
VVDEEEIKTALVIGLQASVAGLHHASYSNPSVLKEMERRGLAERLGTGKGWFVLTANGRIRAREVNTEPQPDPVLLNQEEYNRRKRKAALAQKIQRKEEELAQLRQAYSAYDDVPDN